MKSTEPKQEVKTFATEKVPLPCDEAGTLLPLLQSDDRALNSKSPPLHLLPKHGRSLGLDSKRIIASTKDDRGETTHWVSMRNVFPSAYPSTHPNCTRSTSNPRFTEIPVPSLDPEVEARECKTIRAREFQEWKEICQRHRAEEFYPAVGEKAAREEAERLKRSNPPQLWSCVQRIVPTDQDGNLKPPPSKAEGVTLVFCHGNGFHKEIWEPVIEELLSSVGADKLAIDEIWCIDRSDAGESGVLNREVLGDAISWFDYPRDVSQLLNYHLPSKISDRSGEWTGQLSRTEKGQGRKGRSFVAVGHSMGGTCLSLLSNHQPDLFESIILLDPIIRPLNDLKDFPIPSQTPFSLRSIGKRNAFSSKKEAEKYFHCKGYFKNWDSRTIKIHLEYGLRPIGPWENKSREELETGPCALSNNKFHQAFVYAYGWQGRFSYPALEKRAFKGRIWIISPTEGIYPESINKKARELAKGGELVEGSHSIVQERPAFIGKRIGDLLSRKRSLSHPAQVQARL